MVERHDDFWIIDFGHHYIVPSGIHGTESIEDIYQRCQSQSLNIPVLADIDFTSGKLDLWSPMATESVLFEIIDVVPSADMIGFLHGKRKETVIREDDVIRYGE